MSRAIILDYEDGSVNILPIPEDEIRECEYVEGHHSYNSSSMSYMIVGDSADVYQISMEGDKPNYELIGEI